MDVLKNLPARAANWLRERAAIVEQSPTPKKFTWRLGFADFRSGVAESAQIKITSELGKACQSIYTIFLTDPTSAKTVRKEFHSKKLEKVRAFSRLNTETATESSSCLYVGSSKSTASRLSQHFGFGNKGTYALNIASWAATISGGIEITVYKYENIPQEDIQILEDYLSDQLRPILGRRGAR